jgi:hypothetical protein
MSTEDAVTEFKNHIRWLYEPEFGDFKRKVSLYVERLQQAAPTVSKNAVEKIREAALYNPNGDIESTRRQILELSDRL